MPRKGVPYGGGICSLRERIAELFDLVGEKLHSINGVQGDGQGNVKVVSGDPAVVITNDAAQNEIKIGLDNSKLPSAAVSSVNGQTGAVVLNAGSIPSEGNANVQTDIDAGKAGLQNCIANINTEREARRKADTALQADINAVQGVVQADYVKKAGAAQTVTSQIMVPTTATGTRDTQIANGTRIQNDLDNYATMVRTANAQTIGGKKTFTSEIEIKKDSSVFIDLKRTGIDRTATYNSYTDVAKIRILDNSGRDMFWVDSYVDKGDKRVLQLNVYNADGTSIGYIQFINTGNGVKSINTNFPKPAGW